ncbi:aldo/keto reductase [Sphingomonas sp.]|uniref:aldo/keto reductase n=1 Tax=Sphingomonas sp. TaxID=28214 RepID=UPI0025D8BB9D|nr:aldo/keto reductase [Sphingomonas sp.]
MRYNQLGNTGLQVSELCLGTMTFGETGEGNPMWGAIAGLDQPGVDAIVTRAIDAGINFFDTANIYSNGVSEEMLGRALKNLGTKRTDAVIATKFFGLMGAGPNDRGGSRGHIMDSVDASLTRLGIDHIDLYQMHGTDQVTPVDETLRALDDLVSSGKVRYIGVSNWMAWKIAKALGRSEAKGYARFETLQAYYTIAGRDLERDIVPLLQSEKVGLMVWSPLAGGLLSGKYDRNGDSAGRRASFDFPPVDKDRAYECIDAMRVVADAHGSTVAQVALAYILHKPFVTTVIIGAKRIEQLEDNLKAVDVRLTTEDMATLDAVSALPPEYPGWMVDFQNGGARPESR